MEKSDAKQLKELEKENARLKKLLAEKNLDRLSPAERLQQKLQWSLPGRTLEPGGVHFHS
jgi:hypothetical protein